MCISCAPSLWKWSSPTCSCKWLFWQRWFVESFTRAQLFFRAWSGARDLLRAFPRKGSAVSRSSLLSEQGVLQLWAFPLSVRTISLVKQTESNMLNCHNRGWNRNPGSGSTGMCPFLSVVQSCLEAEALGGPSKLIRGTLESFHPIIGNKLAPLIEGFPEITSEQSSISTQKWWNDDACSTHACTLSLKHLLKPFCG